MVTLSDHLLGDRRRWEVVGAEDAVVVLRDTFHGTEDAVVPAEIRELNHPHGDEPFVRVLL